MIRTPQVTLTDHDHDRAMNALYGDEEVRMRGGRWYLRRLTPDQI